MDRPMKYISNIHQGLALSHLYPSYGLSMNGCDLKANAIHSLPYPAIGNSYPATAVRNWPNFSFPVLTTQPDVQETQFAPLSYQSNQASLARAGLGSCARPNIAPTERIQHSPTSLSQSQLELSNISTAPTLEVNNMSALPTLELSDISTVPAIPQAGTIQLMAHDKLAKEFFHPFYCRRRNNYYSPVEGMTRTRDKYRVVYNEKQRAGLEKEFKDKKFITSKRKAELAEDLELSERQVKIWFQNRRAKERRQTRKEDESPYGNAEDRRTNTQRADLQHPTSCLYATQDRASSPSSSKRPSCLYSSQDRPIPSSSSSLTAADCRYQQHTPGEFVKTYHQLDEQTVPQFPMSPSDWVSSPNNSVLTSFDISPFGTSSASGQCQRT